MSIALVSETALDYQFFKVFKLLHGCFREGSIHRNDLLSWIGLPFSNLFYSACGFIHNFGGPSDAIESRLRKTWKQYFCVVRPLNSMHQRVP